MPSFLEESAGFLGYTSTLRRDFHRHPELGFQEIRTAGIVARELNSFGLEVSTGIAGTGVVGLLEGAKSGPVALLRFDMDALPIEEATFAEYASQITGVMHACGHDGHTAIGLTVARILAAHRQEINGTIKFLFQPAEETMGGAQRTLEDGVLENPRPDFSLALHLWNEKPVGWIGITPGPVMAAAEIFKVRVMGKGGHGAAPHLAIDPVLASAHIVTALQSIVSRNVPPLDTAVISVTKFHAGETFNVIPSIAELDGTMRTFSLKVRRDALERFGQIVKGTAETFSCQADIEIQSLTPAVVNDTRITERVQKVTREMFPQSELGTNNRTMGSEDMAIIMQQIPGCFFFIGSANPEKELDAPHHHPRFDFDEQVLPQATAMMAAAVMDLVNNP